MAFGDSAKEAAEANGELTGKVIEESKQVNALIGKLTSANTSEKECKAALEGLKSIQPDIVSRLNAESLELETLKKRAAEYNQQLVLRIALARKQDQVAAAIEHQTEAGVKQAEKEAALYAYLSQIGAKLAAGDFEYGRHNPTKGFHEWEKASADLQRNLVNHFNEIMAGDLGFGGLMKAILSQFANFLKQIGSEMITFGVMIIAFKSALKSVLANPWAAVAIGAAMVAAAALMTALINKKAKDNAPALAQGGLALGPTYAMVGDNPNARVDPEVIAPLSKLRDMMTGGGTSNINISLSGELTAKGRDLVYALGKENFKTDVLGG